MMCDDVQCSEALIRIKRLAEYLNLPIMHTLHMRNRDRCIFDVISFLVQVGWGVVVCNIHW